MLESCEIFKNSFFYRTPLVAAFIRMRIIGTKWLRFSVLPQFRSSGPEMFCKKSALKNLAKFTEEHMCQSFFFNKVSHRTETLLKKSLWHRCFPVNLARFLRTPFLQNCEFSKSLKTIIL